MAEEKLYSLEVLENRLLLSGDGMAVAAALHSDPFEAVEVEELTSGFTSDFGGHDTVFGASNDPLDLFEGVALEEIHSSESEPLDANQVLGPDKIH